MGDRPAGLSLFTFPDKVPNFLVGDEVTAPDLFGFKVAAMDVLNDGQVANV